MELAAGTRVDERYTVLRPLGQGGLATVWLARHEQIGSLHAIKVLRDPSPSVRQRLLQEGRVQGVVRHRNLVAVTDTVMVEGVAALVLEHVNGPSLAAFLQKHRPTPAQIDPLARGILRGVAAAHRQGLVHRDLKPQNVLLEVADGELVPKVTDFGLAKILLGAGDSGSGGGTTRSNVAMGTPAYMAPEQIRDSASVDARADVFALGSLLYELVSGRRPFEGPDTLAVFAAIAAGAYAPLPPEVPVAWRDAIDRCLRAAPADRFADAAALLEAWTSGAPTLPSGEAWDPGALEVAESLGSGSHGSLTPPVPSSPVPALGQTFAMTGDGLPSLPTSRSETVGPPTPAKPAWIAPPAAVVGRTTLQYALGGALAAAPILGGTAMVSAPETPGILGWTFVGLLGAALVAAGSVVSFTTYSAMVHRAIPMAAWLVPPWGLLMLGHGLSIRASLQVALDAEESAASRATRLGRALIEATAIEFVAEVFAAILLGTICFSAAVSVLFQTGLPREVTRRQTAIGAIALFGGSAVWAWTWAHPSTGGSEGGPMPFLVFLILLMAAGDVAFSTKPLEPHQDTRGARHHQILVVLSSLLAVWASAKTVMLREQLGYLVGAIEGADADRFIAASAGFDGSSLLRSMPPMFAWLVLSVIIAIVGLKGDLRHRLREFAGQIGAVVGFGVAVLSLDIFAFHHRLEGVNQMVPAWAEESVHMQIGVATRQADHGVVVVAVDRPDIPLRAGDVVAYAGGRPIRDVRALAEVLHDRAPGLPLTVTRDDAQVSLVLP